MADLCRNRHCRYFGLLGALRQTNLVQIMFGWDFPYATLSINVLGSFLMGLVFVATLERLAVSPEVRTGILTGFLGGYTTFSTFSMELLLLIEQGFAARALVYLLLSVGLGFAGAFGGVHRPQSLNRRSVPCKTRSWSFASMSARRTTAARRP